MRRCVGICQVAAAIVTAFILAPSFVDADSIVGDFNANGRRDANDIDLLTAATKSQDKAFDLNADGDIDFEDRYEWVVVLSNTYFGDANLDGEFNSGDLVGVFAANKYSTGEQALWSDGDWNGDSVFDSADFLGAFGFPETGYEQGPRWNGIDLGLVRGLLGDFNHDGNISSLDIDLMSEIMTSGGYVKEFDLNMDGAVDYKDHKQWVRGIANTWFGDADLDGEFNSTDLITAFTAAKYERGTYARWSEGDWNGDSRFTAGDFVVAFSDLGGRPGPRNLASVPETSTTFGTVFAMACAIGFVRQPKLLLE